MIKNLSITTREHIDIRKTLYMQKYLFFKLQIYDI